MLASWRERRRRRTALREATKVLERHLLGKDLAELEREGGWDVLTTLHGWKAIDDVWDSFTNAQLEKIMHTSSIVYACVRKICLVAPDAFMEIGRWDGESWEPDEDHPTLELLRQPNPNSDWRTFLWSFLSHWLLTGESYVHKRRNGAGEIIELHAVPTSWISPQSYQGRHWYEVSSGYGEREIVLPEDMFAAFYPDPNCPTRGVGPMQAALKDLQIDDARAAMMIEILSNTHFAGTVLHQSEMWTEDQKAEMRRVLKDVIGPGKRASPLFTWGDGAKVDFPQPPADIDWPGTAGLSESRICACYGIPPMLLGLRVGLEASTYSNYDAARRIFYQDTMRPTWDWTASTLERGLFRDEDLEDEVEAEYDHIPELQEDLDTMHERVRKDFHAGLLTLNEALVATGQDEVPHGDVRVLPMALVPFELGSAGETPPERPPHDGGAGCEPADST